MRRDRDGELVFDAVAELVGALLDGLVVGPGLGQAVDVVRPADLCEDPDPDRNEDERHDDRQEPQHDSGDRDTAVRRLTTFDPALRDEPDDHGGQAEDDAACHRPAEHQPDDRDHQRGDAEPVAWPGRRRGEPGVGLGWRRVAAGVRAIWGWRRRLAHAGEATRRV